MNGICLVYPEVSVYAGKAGDERKAFPSLDKQASAFSDGALLGDQDKKTEAADISVHRMLILCSSLQENGSKLVPTVWIISSTIITTMIIVPVSELGDF